MLWFAILGCPIYLDSWIYLIFFGCSSSLWLSLFLSSSLLTSKFRSSLFLRLFSFWRFYPYMKWTFAQVVWEWKPTVFFRERARMSPIGLVRSKEKWDIITEWLTHWLTDKAGHRVAPQLKRGKTNAQKKYCTKPKSLSKPLRPFCNPLAAILYLAFGAALQAVSEFPRCCSDARYFLLSELHTPKKDLGEASK